MQDADGELSNMQSLITWSEGQVIVTVGPPN